MTEMVSQEYGKRLKVAFQKVREMSAFYSAPPQFANKESFAIYVATVADNINNLISGRLLNAEYEREWDEICQQLMRSYTAKTYPNVAHYVSAYKEVQRVKAARMAASLDKPKTRFDLAHETAIAEKDIDWLAFNATDKDLRYACQQHSEAWKDHDQRLWDMAGHSEESLRSRIRSGLVEKEPYPLPFNTNRPGNT